MPNTDTTPTPEPSGEGAPRGAEPLTNEARAIVEAMGGTLSALPVRESEALGPEYIARFSSDDKGCLRTSRKAGRRIARETGVRCFRGEFLRTESQWSRLDRGYAAEIRVFPEAS